MIFRNVQAVAEGYDISLIKRKIQFKWWIVSMQIIVIYVGATQVHFKSKKSLYRRKQTGKQEANAAMSQKQQRRYSVRKK